MLINEMFKDGYIFSVSTLIGNSLNKDTKLAYNVVKTRQLFKRLKIRGRNLDLHLGVGLCTIRGTPPGKARRTRGDGLPPYSRSPKRPPVDVGG